MKRADGISRSFFFKWTLDFFESLTRSFFIQLFYECYATWQLCCVIICFSLLRWSEDTQSIRATIAVRWWLSSIRSNGQWIVDFRQWTEITFFFMLCASSRIMCGARLLCVDIGFSAIEFTREREEGKHTHLFRVNRASRKWKEESTQWASLIFLSCVGVEQSHLHAIIIPCDPKYFHLNRNSLIMRQQESLLIGVLEKYNFVELCAAETTVNCPEKRSKSARGVSDRERSFTYVQASRWTQTTIHESTVWVTSTLLEITHQSCVRDRYIYCKTLIRNSRCLFDIILTAE